MDYQQTTGSGSGFNIYSSKESGDAVREGCYPDEGPHVGVSPLYEEQYNGKDGDGIYCFKGDEYIAEDTCKGHDDHCDMDRYDIPHGLVAVINNYVAVRCGTEKDEASIVQLFSKEPFKEHYTLYDYKCEVEGDASVLVNRNNKDLGRQAMYGYLDKLKDYLARNTDCYSSFTLFVLSRGNEKGVYPYQCRDESPEDVIPIADLLKSFETVLINKPKLLIIQACQGTDHSTKDEVDLHHTASEERAPSYRLSIPPPKSADMLVACSTLKTNLAYRDKYSGSLFIQTLVRTIRDNYPKSTKGDLIEPDHFADILTEVNFDVTQEIIQRRDETTKVAHDVRQMPYYMSSLRRKLYLLPKPKVDYG